jgi:hypothetical protein
MAVLEQRYNLLCRPSQPEAPLDCVNQIPRCRGPRARPFPPRHASAPGCERALP